MSALNIILAETYAGWARGWSFADLAIFVVAALAICALVWVALQHFKVPVPAWVPQVVGIVVVAFVVIVAIRLVAGM